MRFFCWSSSSLWLAVFCCFCVWLYCSSSTGCGCGVDGAFVVTDAQVNELRIKVESILGLCTIHCNTKNAELELFHNSGNIVYSTREETNMMNTEALNVYINQSLTTGQNLQARRAHIKYEQLGAYVQALNTLIAELSHIKQAVSYSGLWRRLEHLKPIYK